MKKLTTFFLTLLLALVTSSAFATTFDEGKVIQIGEPVTEVQTDQWYGLYSMLGGWIYDKNAGDKKTQAYWLTDESNLTSGMVANDVKDYLIQLVESSTEGAYYIQYANDNYIYMYPTSNQYAWSWSASSTETIVKVEGEETDDIFSIHETGANYCFYTWTNGQYACTSWQNGTVASNWQANYKYQFYPVEIVDPSVLLPEDNDYEIGDEVSIGRKTCTVVGDNLFVNGGFNDGMNGWTAGGYTTAADPDNFDIESEGGYNDGAYLVASSAGTGNAKTPSQAIAVEVGKWYMLVAYTSGKTPDSNNLRYSALFEMDEDGTAELSHDENGTSYSNDIITLDWGVDPGETTDEWTQTIDVFEATTEYVGMRMGWSGGSYDGFQLYEVEVVELGEPTVSGETSHECVAEVDHWTIAGNTNGDFHYNDWSTEDDASGMEVPFLEYWVWSGEGNLSAATISHETLTMEPGTYDVSLDVRIFSEAGNEIGEGTTLTVNGESVDIVAAGTADVYGTETEVYGTYTLTCTLEEVSDLEISINIPEGVEYNWIAFKNLSVTLVEEEPEPEPEAETSHECVAEVDHWTIEGNTNGDFHYNDWSTEDDASGMVVPFLEYWVWSGEGNLSAATISHETLTMEPGTYDVSLDVRIFSEAGNEIGEGTTLTANGESVDIVAAGTADVYGTETEVYGTYVLTCEVGDDGVLDISLDIPEGVDYNWIAFKNLSVTIAEVIEPEPALAEGEYLIVNAEGNYLGGGLTWGTQASIIGKPQFIGFELQEDGTYHLDSHQYNSADSHYLGANLYFDSTPVDWTIEEVDGGYTIYGTVDDGTGYLTSNGFQTVPTVEADPYVWTLLTIEDVIAGMDEATADAPVDVTALIASPELKRNSNTDYHPTWTVTGYDGTGTPSNYAFGGGSAVANCAESYHSTNGFNFSQEITLPLAGYYTLSAQGFYRDDSSETLLLPVMYAGEESVEFPEITRDDDYLGVADNMANAYQEFLLGLHPIDAITIEATEDGETVVIGFKGEDTSLWQIMGELTLLYSGEEAIEPEPEVTGTYVFVAEEWVASDNGRVTADNITYNSDNTITVVASGANNVALGNNPSQSWGADNHDVTTAEYTITEDQCNFVVIGSNLSTEAGDSYWWWMNGINDWTRNSGQIAPDEVYVLDDDQIMFVWDLTYDITTNMTADEDGLITLNGCTCFGLTSTTGTSVISDINFYTNDQVTAITGGTATLIESVETAGTELAKEGIYTMSGVRLNKITKSGIYIVDGKKVMVK